MIFASDSLPLTPPDFGALDSTLFSLELEPDGDVLSGKLTALVPDVGTLTLVGLGALILTRLGRRSSARTLTVLLLLGLIWSTGTTQVRGQWTRGPVLIGGADTDHHFVNSGDSYIREGFTFLGSHVTNENTLAVCIGCNGSPDSDAALAFRTAFEASDLPGMMWTREILILETDIQDFFDNNGTVNIQDAGIVYLPSSSLAQQGVVSGGITNYQLNVVNANRIILSDFVTAGGGLFTHDQSGLHNEYVWLQTLVPEVQPFGFREQGELILDCDAVVTFFPDLTCLEIERIRSAQPWHTSFYITPGETGFGGLVPGARGDPSGRVVILVGGPPISETCLDCNDNEIPDECEPACNDGNPRTDVFCDNGVCLHTNNSDPCEDDGNSCTDDFCDNGVCQHTNNSDPCDDNLFCNGTDTCSGGICESSGDPCLPQVCCENSDTCADECCDDAFCADPDPCRGIRTCVAGVCAGAFTADCNGNGREDSCDIDEGTSGDCNSNNIPDDCEDCNTNGVADSCDIAAGTTVDCGSENDCCVAHSSPGCDDQTVQDCVCLGLPDPCCNAAWTPFCAGIARGFCEASCDANPNGIPDECEHRDCDQNGIPDQCDLDCAAGGLCVDFPVGCGEGADCNANCVLDSCDIAMFLSRDCNLNGIPDECEDILESEPPEAQMDPDLEGEPAQSSKNRYISIKAGSPGRNQAIRVRFVGLPFPFDEWNYATTGQNFFVGEPREACEQSAKGLETDPGDCPAALPTAKFWTARLECYPQYSPHFEDWSAYEVVHLCHEGIIPGGIYNIQVIDAACLLDQDSNYSAPLTMSQARWGDVCGPGPGGACTAVANGAVDVTNDVMGVLDKFANVNSLQKAQADIEPGDYGTNNGPDLVVNVSLDVLYTLDAFGGASYPFTPGDPCNPG